MNLRPLRTVNAISCFKAIIREQLVGAGLYSPLLLPTRHFATNELIEEPYDLALVLLVQKGAWVR